MSAEKLRALAMELMLEVRAKDSELRFKEARIAQLRHEMAVLKRWKFAARSEKLAAEQQSLLDEAVDADLIAIEQELEQLAGRPKKDAEPNKPRRAPLPANLPRVEVRHEPASTTCACGCQLKRIGEDVSEKLDYTSGVFTVERHVRGKWVCQQCETLIQAPVPAQVIDKGITTAGLLAQVLVSKCDDYVPLYRQERIFERASLAIPRSTLAQWVGACGVQLQTLADALKQQVPQHAVLHADEMPVAMLSPGKGKTQRAPLDVLPGRLRGSEGRGLRIRRQSIRRAPARARGGRRFMTNLHARRIRRQQCAARLVRLGVLRRLRGELLELVLNGDQVRFDSFVQQALLLAREFLAARSKLPRLEHGHLVRKHTPTTLTLFGIASFLSAVHRPSARCVRFIVTAWSESSIGSASGPAARHFSSTACSPSKRHASPATVAAARTPVPRRICAPATFAGSKTRPCGFQARSPMLVPSAASLPRITPFGRCAGQSRSARLVGVSRLERDRQIRDGQRAIRILEHRQILRARRGMNAIEAGQIQRHRPA